MDLRALGKERPALDLRLEREPTVYGRIGLLTKDTRDPDVFPEDSSIGNAKDSGNIYLASGLRWCHTRAVSARFLRTGGCRIEEAGFLTAPADPGPL